MRSEGFSFNSDVWRLELCSPSVARAFATVVNCRQPCPAADVRSEGAKPHRWAALAKCDKIISWRSISSQITWFSWVLRHALRLRLLFAWRPSTFTLFIAIWSCNMHAKRYYTSFFEKCCFMLNCFVYKLLVIWDFVVWKNLNEIVK